MWARSWQAVKCFPPPHPLSRFATRLGKCLRQIRNINSMQSAIEGNLIRLCYVSSLMIGVWWNRLKGWLSAPEAAENFVETMRENNVYRSFPATTLLCCAIYDALVLNVISLWNNFICTYICIHVNRMLIKNKIIFKKIQFVRTILKNMKYGR